MLGDIDGDGDLDAVLTTNTTPNVLVMENDGGGSFLLPQVITIPDKHAVRAFAGDLDGDGRVDLVVALRSEGFVHQLAVLTSLPGGGFDEPVLVDLPSSAQDIDLVDLDGDSDLDLAIASNSSGVCVIRNQGGLAFGPPERYDDVGSLPRSIATGDIDGDGDADLAVSVTGGVRILINQGDGSLESGQWFAFSGLDRTPVLEDLDGDGRLDVAIAGPRLSYWLQDDMGEFVGPTVLDVQPDGEDFEDLLAVDLDSDGPRELVATGSGLNPNVFVFSGVSGVGPSHPVVYGSDERGPHVAAGDVDGDGDQDLVVARPLMATFEVFTNRGDGRLLARQLLTFQQFCLDAIVADIDGDGRADVLAIERSDLLVYRNAGDAVFEHPPISDGNRGSRMLDADFNNDGHTDVAELDLGRGNVWVRLGDGEGGFDLDWVGDIADRSDDFDAADVNGDGLLDLVCVDRRAWTIVVFLGMGDGTFTSGGAYLTNSPYNSRVVLGDIDGDSDADALVLTGYSSGRGFRVMRNEGDGSFVHAQTYTTADEPREAALADINADGHLDVIVAANPVEVRRNAGDGTFLDAEPQGVRGNNLAIGDLDGDGNPDLAVTAIDSTDIGVLLNDGSGGFALEGQYAHDDLFPEIDLGDLDGDGRLDIVLSSGEDPNDGVHILINQGGFGVCPADLDGDGTLSIFDFLAFQNAFDAGDPIADFDGDGSLTIFDFLAFQNAFDMGC